MSAHGVSPHGVGRQRAGQVAVTDADILAIVRDAVSTVLERDPEEVRPETSLRDLDADSLALVEMAEIVEERLATLTGTRLVIPDADLESFTTIADAVSYAMTRVG